MTPLPEWLRPPKLLLSILALLTLVSVSALASFGWKFFQQDRIQLPFAPGGEAGFEEREGRCHWN